MNTKEKQLFAAINRANVEEVESLMEGDIDINCKDKELFAWTLLQHCIFNGAFKNQDKYFKIAQLLIEKGADVEGLTATEAPPVLFAIKYFALDFLDLLLANGGSLYAYNSQNRNIFDIILESYYRDQQLDEEHINDIKDEEVKEAILRGEDESLNRFFRRVDAIVKHGYDLNAGKYPTAYCAILEIHANNFPAKSLPFLFEKGADPQGVVSQENGQFVPLFYFACSSQTMPLAIVVDMAKRIGINHVFLQISNLSPLLIAIICKRLDVIQSLVELGADVHIHNDRAIRIASGIGDIDIVDFFLNQSLDVNAVDGNGKNAIDIAQEEGFDELVNYLKSKVL